MIIIPIMAALLLEIILGYIIFFMLSDMSQGMEMFLSLRLVGMLLILVITNGLLTYFVSKSIIKPITELSEAAKRISEGDLNFEIKSVKKDELGQLSNTFDRMRQNLKEAKEWQAKYEQERLELITSISHDLKTPLTSIKGYVKGIQDGVANTPDKLDRYLETIYKKADDLDGLIEKLFLYSKFEMERVPFQFEPVDLYTFFEDFVEELQFNLEEESGTALLQANKDDSYVVQADREQLKRVVTNITQNSMKYMKNGYKRIEVQLKAEPDQVVVGIADNGSGIPKEDLPFIFDRFYRTDTSRNSATGGSGLGLAIVKKIIEESSGTVWVDSEVGQGTKINFTLKKVT
ncbi:histidine kinase [Bacillus horti]|uniref:histidine kinase n=2 Tax=Caldalkalibacillus horti TaxID=77523 RepID=A0ABT9VZ05_9BACI|nr:histidine kinase [Bacillus horti]